MEQYRLPDGRYTWDVEAYTKSWNEISQPIEDHFGLTLTACDPDLVFHRVEGGRLSYNSLRLDTRFARDLCFKLREYETLCELADKL